MIRRIRSWRLLLLVAALVEQRRRSWMPLSNAFSPTVLSSIGSPRHPRTTSTSAPVPRAPSSSAPFPTTPAFTAAKIRGSSSRLLLRASLWDRLELDEDDEPFWYLLNCVAGNELDLLRQCQMACSDFDSTEVSKFVVPTINSVRSHGANRMVNDVKVKYPGYVFAKVRLCQPVYETLQGLDLCRSWMGTVNQRGYKKLPPAPLALNEDEIEKFGLERDDFGNEAGDDRDGDGSGEAGGTGSGDDDEDGVIVDTAERDELDKAKAIDPKELKVYQGLKVEDMVKVTAQNKFWNEDGIVRRLKDGKLLVRFYTYGSMYEEWLQPGDVRKLSSMEILRGLAGPSQPVTQRDLESNDRYGGSSAGPGNARDSRGPRRDSPFQQAFGGPQDAQARNRRQDRTANRFRSDRFANNDERRRDETNWNWYKDQQQQQRGPDRRPNSFSPNGRDYWTAQAGDPADDNDAALRDVDSQWGRSNDRMPAAQPWRERQQQQRQPQQRQPGRDTNRFENRRVQSAIEGRDDWSAFVSRTPASSSAQDRGSEGRRSQEGSSSANQSRERRSSKNSDVSLDDFFDSLMDGLSKDLGTSERGANRYSDRPSNDADGSPTDTRGRRDRTATPGGSRKSEKDDDDDGFFASLMSELQESVGDGGSSTEARQASSSRRSDSPGGEREDSEFMFDDFLSSFDEERVDSKPAKDKREVSLSTERSTKRTSSKKSEPLSVSVDLSSTSRSTYDDDDDDFFASLAAELDADTNAAVSTAHVIKADRAAASPDDDKSTDTGTSAATKRSSPVNADGAGATSTTALDKLTVPALKELLKERGLKVTGKKSELIERLSS